MEISPAKLELLNTTKHNKTLNDFSFMVKYAISIIKQEEYIVLLHHLITICAFEKQRSWRNMIILDDENTSMAP